MTRDSRLCSHAALAGLFAVAAAAVVGCRSPREPTPDELVARGEQIFFNETFEGNGRTCGTCHPAEENFSLSPAFIASLPAGDPLFVAESEPALASGFENPVLMRAFALILENQDGFDDLAQNFNMRGVPHTLALPTSVASSLGSRTGWSGDGAPGDGSLRSFATGAVIQHFTRSTNRIAGVDFRLPSDEELDALLAFQLSLGRRTDPELPLPLRGVVASRGQEIFLDNGLGKCNACHFNAGANADPRIFGPNAGNRNFDTGVEDLPDPPAALTGERVPPDDGFGTPGNGEFNTPPLVEAADTGPFFHDNSVETIEGAVAFYNGDAFTSSPAGQLLIDATGSAIDLEATQVVAVSAFLRVINALENIRASLDLLARSRRDRSAHARSTVLLQRAERETEDAIDVLSGAGLHPNAVQHLREARAATDRAARSWWWSSRAGHVRVAIAAHRQARERLIAPRAQGGSGR